MKTALFVFNRDPLCYIHVMFNALDMHGHGYFVRVVLEGASVQLVPILDSPEHPRAKLFAKVRQKKLLDGACRACSVKLGVAKEVERAGVNLIGDMSGHPSMRAYLNSGFQVITF